MAAATFISEVNRPSRDIRASAKTILSVGTSLRRKQTKAPSDVAATGPNISGPFKRWGSCNSWEGHFGAVALPFCKPEKLAILCYIFEYAFLCDNVVESIAKCTLNAHADNLALDETEHQTVSSITGTKRIQSKMLLELLSIDAPCVEVVIEAWKTMISATAKQDKARRFANLEGYIVCRIVDTRAPFVDMLMRFGMGILLTPEEDEMVAPIVKRC